MEPTIHYKFQMNCMNNINKRPKNIIRKQWTLLHAWNIARNTSPRIHLMEAYTVYFSYNSSALYPICCALWLCSVWHGLFFILSLKLNGKIQTWKVKCMHEIIDERSITDALENHLFFPFSLPLSFALFPFALVLYCNQLFNEHNNKLAQTH